MMSRCTDVALPRVGEVYVQHLAGGSDQHAGTSPMGRIGLGSWQLHFVWDHKHVSIY